MRLTSMTICTSHGDVKALLDRMLRFDREILIKLLRGVGTAEGDKRGQGATTAEIPVPIAQWDIPPQACPHFGKDGRHRGAQQRPSLPLVWLESFPLASARTKRHKP
jgi:hypothetical protein